MYPKYLVKNPSNSSFFFRSYLPLDLRDLYQGKIEFRVSLKCGNKNHSKKICSYLNEIIQELYEEIRMGKSLTIEEMKRILSKEIEKSKKHSSWFSYVGVDRSKEYSKEQSLKSLDIQEIELKGRNKKDFDDQVERLLLDEGITVDRKSDYFRLFRENFIKIQNLKIKWKRDIIKGETRSEFDLVSQILDGEPEQPPITVQTPIETKPPIETQSIIFSKMVKEFLEERDGVVGNKLHSEYKSIFDDLMEIIGDIPVKTITKEGVISYTNIQKKLPINRKKNPKYRDLTLEEILKLKNVTPQSRLNVNKYLTRISTLMNWGKSRGYIDENLFKGMKVPLKKTEQRKRRQPFSTDDLRKILTPTTFFDWTLKFRHPLSDITKNQNSYYWVFPIGILSGMRTNEICQLRIEDIIQEKNVWMFRVDESETTKVKTPSGIRRVPVHPNLISLGFLDYVERLKKDNEVRVFPSLTKSRDGYSSKVSRHYNEKFLRKLGIWKKQTKVLYSTRHTFINKCYSKSIDRDIIKSIVGHEPDFTIDVYGGNPFTPDQLFKGISKVSYSNIRWDRLKVDWERILK